MFGDVVLVRRMFGDGGDGLGGFCLALAWMGNDGAVFGWGLGDLWQDLVLCCLLAPIAAEILFLRPGAARAAKKDCSG